MAKQREPTKKELKDQLESARALKGALDQVALTADRIADSFSAQATAMNEMRDAMASVAAGDTVGELRQINSTLQTVVELLGQLNSVSTGTFEQLAAGAGRAAQSMDAAGNAAGRTSRSVQTTSDRFRELARYLSETGGGASSFRYQMGAVRDFLEDEFAPAVGFVVGALSGLQQGFRTLMALGSGLFNFITEVASGLFDITKSLIAIPFKIFDGLIDMAKKAMSQISPLMIALNNIRKEFGHLSGPVASSIQKVAWTMKGFSDSGLSAFRVFGNVAEIMEQVNKLFVAGGAALQSFTKEFNENGGAILGYQRGLGLTDEQMGAIGIVAKSTGKELTSVLNSSAKQALALGKAFEIDAKLISKDMGKARADMAHFGNVSEKQIGIAVTYFRKLGLELDKVTGAMDAFSTYDEAADKVSTLNQVFGTQLDAMKLVNAQSPEETISHLREQFAKAGIAGETLTRAQRQIIKQNTNLDDSQIALAFSSKNQAVSLNQVTKEADKAEKATLSQTAALKGLADAMERNLKAGETREGGFFSYFMHGFTDGLQRTKEFRELLRNIGRSLMEVYYAGRQVGKAFVDYFPGVKEFLGGLADIFDPSKFRKLAGDVRDVFIQFFKDLNDPSGKASFSSLMDKLKEKFFDFFDKQTGAGSKTLSGFSKMMDAIKVILAGGIEWVMTKIGGFISDVARTIANPGAALAAAGSAAGTAEQYLSPLTKAFREGWKVLGPALEELFDVLFDKLSNVLYPKLKSFAENNWQYIAAILFGPALLQGMLGAFTGLLTQVFVKGMAAAATRAAVSRGVTDALTGLAGSAGQNATATVTAAAQATNAAGTVNPAAAASAQATGAIINGPMIAKLLVALAVIAAIGLATFWAAAKIVEGMSVETVIKALVVMGAIVVEMVGLSAALWILQATKVPNLGALLLQFLVLGAAMIALAGLARIIVAILGSVDVKQAMVAVGIILGMSLVAITVSASLWMIASAGTMLTGSGGSILIAIAAGFGLLAVAILGLAGLARVLIWASSDMTFEQLKSAGMFITIAIGAVLAAAMAFALFAFAGSAGILASVSAVAGFVILKAAIEGLVSLASIIVEEAKKLPDDFGPKAEAFKNIMDSVVNIIKAITPDSLFSSVDDDDFEKLPAVLEKLTEHFKAVLGDAAAGTGLMGMVKVIVGAVQSIGASEENLKGAAALADVLKSVAGVASAMSPQGMGEMFKAVDDDDFEKLPGVIGKFSDHVTEMVKALLGDPASGQAGILPAIKELITGIKGMTPAQAESVKAVAALIGSLAPLAQALTFPQGAYDMLKMVADRWGEDTATTIKAMGSYAGQMAGAIRDSGIIETMGKQIGEIVSKLANISFTEQDAKALEVIGPLLGGLVKFASSMFETAKEAMNKPFDFTAGPRFQTMLKSMADNLPGIFKAIAGGFGDIVEGIKTAAGKIPTDPAFLNKIESLKKVFEIVQVIRDVAGSLPTQAQTSGGLPPADGLHRDIALLAILFYKLLKEPGYGTSMPVLEELFTWVGVMVEKFGPKATEMAQKIEQIAKVFESIKKIIDSVTSLNDVKMPEGHNIGGHFISALRQVIIIFEVLGGGMGTELLTALGSINVQKWSSIDAPLKVLTDVLPKIKSAAESLSGFPEKFDGTGLGDMFSSIALAVKSLNANQGDKPGLISTLSTFLSTNIVALNIINTQMQVLLDSLDKLGSLASALKKPIWQSPLNTTMPTLNFRNLVSFFQVMKEVNFQKTLQDLEQISTAAKSFIKVGYEPVAASVEGMANAIIDIDKSLQKPYEIDIRATLSKLKANFGAMGGKGQIQKNLVTTKPVQINATFYAIIDAKKLEGAILEAKGGIITDRINLILAATAAAQPEHEISTNQTSSNPKEVAMQTIKNNAAAPSLYVPSAQTYAPGTLPTANSE